MKFYLKIHKRPKEKLVAVCDAELMGREIKHNEVDLKIQERFYGELEYALDEVIREIRNCTSYNVIGKNICEALIEENLLHPYTVMWINDGDDKIGHAIFVR